VKQVVVESEEMISDVVYFIPPKMAVTKLIPLIFWSSLSVFLLIVMAA